MASNIVLSFLLVCIVLTEIPSTQQKTLPILTEEQCHPDPAAGSDQYMVGYGSLMNTASKSRTYPNTGESLPVTISGFGRRWNAQGASVGYSTTYLGIELDSSDSFNGVVFKLPTTAEDVKETLESYDDREAWYCRQKVDVNSVKFYNKSLAPDHAAEFWIYVNKPEFTIGPNEKYPIVESYVDIFVAGCLELEDKYELTGFTSDCISTTKGWSNHWVNDRLYPRRPFLHEPKASKIDKILAAAVPDFYKAIKIE